MRLKLTKGVVLPGVCGVMLAAGTALAFADTTVEVKGTHLCCGACVKGVGTALKGIDVKAKCDREAGTVTITAKDEATAQKALDALGAAGYFGDTGSKTLTIKPGTAPKGTAKAVTVSGVHNCCGACNKAIKAAVKTVSGVTGDTAKSKSATFEVKGDFDPEAVIKALNAAGFNASAKD
jgi:copper chaperone CopZ